MTNRPNSEIARIFLRDNCSQFKSFDKEQDAIKALTKLLDGETPAESRAVADPDHECSLQAAITAYHAALPPGEYGETVSKLRSYGDAWHPMVADAIEALEAKCKILEESSGLFWKAVERAETAESALAAERGKVAELEGLYEGFRNIGFEPCKDVKCYRPTLQMMKAANAILAAIIVFNRAVLSTKGPENGNQT